MKMDSEHVRMEEVELLRRTPSNGGSSDDDLAQPASYVLDDFEDDTSATLSLPTTRAPRWLGWSRAHNLLPSRHRRSLRHQLCHILALISYSVVALVVICGAFFPSYSDPPERYINLRKALEKTGTVNARNEKIYIAASLYDKDGELLSGPWGHAVLGLIDILGADNVFLSIYENDASEKSQQAMRELETRLTCQSSLVSEHLDLAQMPHVITADGIPRLKRIAYLAQVRNNALRPLDDPSSTAYDTHFDKLLYINDVIFDPLDAAQLLLSTNRNDRTMRTEYRAACAVDFINPFKFYDTFATRDLEGYNMGVPFFPWFTGAGRAQSRKDVLAQKDAVRVKSCWGGMVALEAKWFQPRLAPELGASLSQLGSDEVKSTAEVANDVPDWRHSGSLEKVDLNDLTFDPEASTLSSRSDNTTTSSLRFRAETDTYWDSSECCLIHADLTALASGVLGSGDTGIYMNPYVRVAYSKSTLIFLGFTKRFERLYTPIHTLVNWIAQRPSFNPRRLQQPGDEIIDQVWMWDESSLEAIRNDTVADLPDGLQGGYQEVKREALPGQFCGSRNLLYINEHRREGESNWAREKVPAVE